MALYGGRPGRAKELATIYRNHLKSTQLTEDNALEVLRVPLIKFKRRQAEAFIGRKTPAVSYQEFIENGERWFGKERFERYLASIEANPLAVDMIFAGFIGALPVLCECEERRNK